MKMKIGVLTSTRADYGIYLPLLNKMKEDSFFSIEIIAFGTHISVFHGRTIDAIIKDQYRVIHSIQSILISDDTQSISTSYGLTVLKFSDFWKSNYYDLVFCLGDRFEMSAAVQAGIPYGVHFAHIHGGETTLGAIDNVYRHQISLASSIHFTSTRIFEEKVKKLTGLDKNIFNIGSLSLNNVESFEPIKSEVFYSKYKIPNEEYALITFHPETLRFKKNSLYATIMRKALNKISKNLFLVITMPNADTNGSIFRKEIESLKNQIPNRVRVIENFGNHYFSAIYYSKLIIGNSSSGIIEAASFGKYVINIGDRQKGREQSSNVINCEFDEKKIIKNTKEALKLKTFNGDNIYYKKNSVEEIIRLLKEFYEK